MLIAIIILIVIALVLDWTRNTLQKRNEEYNKEMYFKQQEIDRKRRK